MNDSKHSLTLDIDFEGDPEDGWESLVLNFIGLHKMFGLDIAFTYTIDGVPSELKELA
jgi:hypothetical protein